MSMLGLILVLFVIRYIKILALNLKIICRVFFLGIIVMLSVFQNLKLKPALFFSVDHSSSTICQLIYSSGMSLYFLIWLNSQKKKSYLRKAKQECFMKIWSYSQMLFALKTIPDLEHFILSLFSLIKYGNFFSQNIFQKISK